MHQAGSARAGGHGLMATKWNDRALVVGPWVTLVQSDKQFQAAMKQCRIPKDERGTWIQPPTADATAHFFEAPRAGLTCIVALRVSKDITPIQICSLLVHESVHIWQRFKARIVEIDPSPEFEAYSVQAISQGLMQAYADSLEAT